MIMMHFSYWNHLMHSKFVFIDMKNIDGKMIVQNWLQAFILSPFVHHETIKTVNNVKMNSVCKKKD